MAAMRSGVSNGWAVAVLFGAVLLGCVRMVAPGTSALLAGRQGEACGADDACTSGFCTNGVCCDVRCDDPEKACHLPSALGTCQMKTKGATCSEDAHCPEGAPFCSGENVCCEAACEQACHSCNNPGAAGVCLPVADNTDPYGECDGVCTSCQGGSCGATFPGIDPLGECSFRASCNGFGACAVDLGERCDGTQSCANGSCVLGRCRVVQIEEFRLPLPVAGVGDYRVTSLDTGPEGRSVVGVKTQYVYVRESDSRTFLAPGPVMAGVEVSDVAWRSPLVSVCTDTFDWLSVIRVGAMSQMILAQNADDPNSGGLGCQRPTGFFESILLSPTGELLDRSRVGDLEPEPFTDGPSALALRSDGTIMAALVTRGATLKLATRAPNQAVWAMEDVPDGRGSWGQMSVLELDGTPAILDFAADEPQLRLQLLRNGGEVTRASFPADCLELSELAAEVLPGTRGQRALVVFTCDTTDYTTLHRPGTALIDVSLPVDQRVAEPAYITFVRPPDGLSPFSESAFTASPAALDDGTPGLLFGDRRENVWWAYESDGGLWDTVSIQYYGASGDGQRVRNLVAHRGPRGIVVAWSQQFRYVDTNGLNRPASDSKLVRATITP
jgi:hypothetical protein